MINNTRFKSRLKATIVTLIIVVSIMIPQLTFAQGTYDSVYGPEPTPAGNFRWWKYSNDVNVKTYNTFDDTESVEANVTADAKGEFSWAGQKFSIGVSGTVKCIFTRSRYDSWREYDRRWIELRDSTYTGHDYLQHCKVWQNHVYNSWVLGNYSKV